jgi:hypothetical protein
VSLATTTNEPLTPAELQKIKDEVQNPTDCSGSEVTLSGDANNGTYQYTDCNCWAWATWSTSGGYQSVQIQTGCVSVSGTTQRVRTRDFDYQSQGGPDGGTLEDLLLLAES